MRAGVWNIVFGLVAVGAGASGKFGLLGTGSPLFLMIAGGALAAFGGYQLFRDRDRPGTALMPLVASSRRSGATTRAGSCRPFLQGSSEARSSCCPWPHGPG